MYSVSMVRYELKVNSKPEDKDEVTEQVTLIQGLWHAGHVLISFDPHSSHKSLHAGQLSLQSYNLYLKKKKNLLNQDSYLSGKWCQHFDFENNLYRQLFILCIFVCMGEDTVYLSHRTYVDNRDHVVGISFLFAPC